MPWSRMIIQGMVELKCQEVSLIAIEIAQGLDVSWYNELPGQMSPSMVNYTRKWPRYRKIIVSLRIEGMAWCRKSIIDCKRNCQGAVL